MTALPLASWGRRAGALLLDGVILALTISFAAVAGGVSPAELNEEALSGSGMVALLFFVVPEALYDTLMIGSRNQTLGKMAFRIAVVDAGGGGRIGYRRAFLRWVTTSIFWALWLVPGILDHLWPLRDSRRQTLARQARAQRRREDAVSDEEQLDPEIEERIAEPVSEEARNEIRLTPAEAIEKMHLNLPVRGNKKLRKLMDRVDGDRQLKAWWHVSNVNAVARMEINDHSWVHIQIVANIALKILRQLFKHGVEPSMVRDYGMSREDAEVVVTLSALLHCIGMSVHRHGHEDFSLFLAEPKMRELLAGLYEEPELTVVISEVLQAITSHRSDGQPLALEAGILRVADALDMAEGRSRIPFERGRVSMHSLSAAAIDDVSIGDGETHPVRIEIVMNNSSGLFQVDGLLKAKLRGSGLEPYVEVIAHIDTDAEKRLVEVYKLET